MLSNFGFLMNGFIAIPVQLIVYLTLIKYYVEISGGCDGKTRQKNGKNVTEERKQLQKR